MSQSSSHRSKKCKIVSGASRASSPKPRPKPLRAADRLSLG